MPDSSETHSTGVGPTASARLESLRVETSRSAKAVGELERAVTALLRQLARLEAAPRQVRDSVTLVRDLRSKLTSTPDFEPVLTEIEDAARAAEDRATTRFGTSLAATLRAKIADPRELRPMESGFSYGALRILFDSVAGRVHIEYARRSVLKNLAADPEAVGAAIAKFLDDLEKPPFDPETFLRKLSAAYTHSIAATGKAPGELVDILDFCGFLVWEMQSETFRKEPTAKRFRDYPHFRFAHDLARLRAARHFEIGGRRLELEVAVHDRAYGRSLWVPEEKTGGTYYQAIGLRPGT